MKTLYSSLIAATFAILTGCSSHKEHYAALDRAIERQEHYDSLYIQVKDSLAGLFRAASPDSAKWEYAYSLHSMLLYHDIDSSCHYKDAMMKLCSNDSRQRKISECCHVNYIYKIGELETALRIFERLDTTGMSKECLNLYFDTGYHIYRDLAMSFPEHEQDRQKIMSLWWLHDSTNVKCVYYNNERLRKQGKTEEAIARLNKCSLKNVNDTIKVIDFIAREYLYCNDHDNAIKYFSIAAERDMRVSAKTYNALYALARILLQKGEIERAARYMHITRKDAFAANLKTRYDQVLLTEMEIMQLLIEQHKQRQTAYFIATIVIALFLVIAVVLLGLLSRSSTRLMLSKEKLSEVSKIKDKFLAIYLEKCVEFLNKVDNYRSSLRSAMKHEGIEAVTAMLRQPSFADGEFKELLADFDSAFLGIFPDFADKVNKHMKEGHHLTMPSEGELSTELRILALIRMGICKRQKIAKVLNMSVTTVYSYHSNLKKHSIHSDASFDKIIANL